MPRPRPPRRSPTSRRRSRRPRRGSRRCSAGGRVGGRRAAGPAAAGGCRGGGGDRPQQTSAGPAPPVMVADRFLSGTAAQMYMQGGDLQDMTTLVLAPPGVMSDLAVVIDSHAHRVRDDLDNATAAARDAAVQERVLVSARNARDIAAKRATDELAATTKDAARACAEAATLGHKQEALAARLEKLKKGAADLVEPARGRRPARHDEPGGGAGRQGWTPGRPGRSPGRRWRLTAGTPASSPASSTSGTPSRGGAGVPPTRRRALTASRRRCRAGRWPAPGATGSPTRPPRSPGGWATSSRSTGHRARPTSRLQARSPHWY